MTLNPLFRLVSWILCALVELIGIAYRKAWLIIPAIVVWALFFNNK